VFATSVPFGPLPGGVPIAAMIGDSHAALFGQGGFQPGAIKATYGTGSSLMTPTRGMVPAGGGIASTVAWARADTTYALEGNITVTGAAVQWLGRLFDLEHPSDEVTTLAAQVPDSDGVYLVPAFAGLGAPHWSTAARGLICGLTDRTTLAHLARATLDAIAFQVRDVFEAMRARTNEGFAVLLADGGPSRNDLLMQMQANTLNLPVVRTASPDLSALGAAYLAGLTVGYWPTDDAVLALIGPRDRFEPAMDAAKRDSLYQGWRDALARTVLETSSLTEQRRGGI
jgi:glycerol kinase